MGPAFSVKENLSSGAGENRRGNRGIASDRPRLGDLKLGVPDVDDRTMADNADIADTVVFSRAVFLNPALSNPGFGSAFDPARPRDFRW